MMQKVVPAILTKDPAQLQRQLQLLKEHTKWVHIDIMDGKFVPAVSINLAELGEASQFFNLEIHLMVKDPENYLEDCSGIGAKRVIFHVEASESPDTVLEEMQKYAFQKGIALSPSTSVESVKHLVSNIDSVLLLSVVPGAQGQAFIPSVLDKISPVRSQASNILIGLDGGVAESNIKDIFASGADYVAVGSAIWKDKDQIAAFRNLEKMVN
jgi:ribulose-phosphate 3-epimerase